MSRKKHKPKRERVCWSDARGEDGWLSRDDLEIRLAHVTTIGYVIAETKQLLGMASSWDNKTKQMFGVIFIPKATITKREEI